MKLNYKPDFSKNHRRTFLRQFGAGITALAVPNIFLNGKANTIPPINKIPFLELSQDFQDESYWEMVKKQFIIAPGKIMVNAANLCPSPHFVNERVANYSQDLASDVSFQNRGKFGKERGRVIKRMAKFLNVDSLEIGITRNTSESNNIVVNGLDFGAEDEILIWDQNHPTNNIAWEQRARRYGFVVKKISVPSAPESKADLVKAFKDQMSPRTRLIAFSHISNVSGIALPAKEICQMAREQNVLTLVDGAQSFGFLNLDLRAMGCDFYSSSTHKWLMGPMENGILYARKAVMDKLWPNIIAAGWKEDHQSLDEKVCVLGQRNTPSTPAIIDIIDFHETVGTPNIEARVRYLNAYLKEQIRKKLPNATFVTPLASELSGGITIFRLPGKEPRMIFQKLYENYGIAGAPTGGIRLSPHIYCTSKDMDRIVEALVALAGD